MNRLALSLSIGLIALGLGHLLAQLAGPFGLAAGVRWGLMRPWLPAWVQAGAACPFCWAFWAALGATWLISGVPLGREFVAMWLAGYGLAVAWLLYTGH